MIDAERGKEIIKGANIETFIQKIKELPIYGAYKRAVERMEDEETDKFLQFAVMLYGAGDSEFGLMMNSVALDLLFAFTDQKLRAEILGGKESKG